MFYFFKKLKLAFLILTAAIVTVGCGGTSGDPALVGTTLKSVILASPVASAANLLTNRHCHDASIQQLY